MSIPDLLEKINAPAKETFQAPGGGDPPKILVIGMVMAVLLGVSGWGGVIFIVRKLQVPQPVEISCSEELLRSLESSSSMPLLEGRKGKSKQKR